MADYIQRHPRYPGGKTRAITLSYDDGKIQDRQLVALFNQYGLKGTFNLNSGTFGHESVVATEEMPALYENHEVAVHTLTHPYLNYLSTAEVAYQVIEDRKRLEVLFGRVIRGMAYPFRLAETPGQVETIRNCGIQYARTTVNTLHFDLPQDAMRWNPTCHHKEETLPELVERFLSPEDPAYPERHRLRLLYVWGHSYEFAGKWDEAKRICRLLGGHETVWYATNGQIMDYLLAWHSLQASVDGSIVHNPSGLPVWFWAQGKEWVLQPGKTVCLA